MRFQRGNRRFDEPGRNAQASVLGGRSFGRNDQLFDITAGAPTGYARVSTNRSQAGDYADGNGARVPSAWKKWNTDAALGWTPDADTFAGGLCAGIGNGQARYAGRGMVRSFAAIAWACAEKAFGGMLRKLPPAPIATTPIM